MALQEGRQRFLLHSRAGLNASYWLGLIAMERGDYESAITWLQQRTLDRMPNGPWIAGAHYNLGRCHEALGKYTEAIQHYLQGVGASAQSGNVLRARWLGAHRPPIQPPKATVPTPEESSPGGEDPPPATPPASAIQPA